MSVYLDCAATAPINIQILNRVLKEYPAGYLFGNPSSIHYDGIKAKEILEKAREIIAHELNCKTSEIYFTSGGSESNNTALKGIMLKYKPNEAEMITSEIEHPSILNTCKELSQMGYTIRYVKPDKVGEVKKEQIENLINPKTKLISIMSVNNELGTRTCGDFMSLKKKYPDIVFHSDKVQAFIDSSIEGLDMASYSGHKFGSVKGIGILYKKENLDLHPLINGGGQEHNLRSGTENVFGAIDMALCLKEGRLKWKNEFVRLRDLKTYIVKLLNEQEIDFEILSSPTTGLPNVLTLAFRNIDSSVLQLMLSQKGYYVSTGSACHSNTTQEISHVVKSIGVPKEYQKGIIRISMPFETTKREIEEFVEELIKAIDYLDVEYKTIQVARKHIVKTKNNILDCYKREDKNEI